MRRALLFPALILTGCGSDRTVSLTALDLALGCFVFAGFSSAYLLYKFGEAHKEVMRLRAESLRGKITRVGALSVDHEAGILQLEGWGFEGGYTGQLIAGYKPSELRDMEHAEIDRVARLAVSEVGR